MDLSSRRWESKRTGIGHNSRIKGSSYLFCNSSTIIHVVYNKVINQLCGRCCTWIPMTGIIETFGRKVMINHYLQCFRLTNYMPHLMDTRKMIKIKAEN